MAGDSAQVRRTGVGGGGSLENGARWWPVYGGRSCSLIQRNSGTVNRTVSFRGNHSKAVER